jgi:hypothetical protein
MARRFQKTLVDYLVIAISPALIMTLVCSLVFFLQEVFYQGNFQGRLQYIFALFVIGTVLIGRISIEEGRERAALFAVPLGIVTLLAINKFVEFQGGSLASLNFFINFGLIGLVWWSADRLTWDCTLIDESEDDSGEGLLEAVGLDRPGKTALRAEVAPLAPEPEATTSREERPMGWWERFVERRRRPHAPGVWVIYFSLAAVAIFGIGQLFIPTNDLPRRQYAFHLLCIYTASGLGLLLATSFLGLRRYLRQRRQEMPLSMVNLWLVLGASLIVGVMLMTLVLPRPNPEYAISELPFRIGSPDQKSSPYGTGREAVREQQPWSRGVRQDDQKSVSAPSDRPSGESSSDRQEPPRDGQTTARPDEGNARTSPQNRNRPEQPSSASDKSQAASDKPERVTPSQAAEDDKRNAAADGAGTPPNKDRGPRQSGDRGSGNLPPVTNFQQLLHEASNFVSAPFLKWLFYGVLVSIAVFSIWSHRHELLAALGNFGEWLSDFWQRLFGGTVDRADSVANEATTMKTPQRRFVDFTDPFATGLAGTWPPEELVRYTFEALEAWAQEHGYPRQPEQTPHEFARSLAVNISSLADDTGRLADLYCQAAYASSTLPAASIARLSQLWQNLALCATGTKMMRR